MSALCHQALLGSCKPLAVLSSLSFITSASTSAASLTWPSVNAGDLAIVFDYGRDSGDITLANLSGFTSVAGAEQGNIGVTTTDNEIGRVWIKICTGSESGSFATTNGNQDDGAILLIFRGNVPISTVTPLDWGSEMTSGTPSGQTVTAAGGVTPVLVLGAVGSSSSSTVFSTFSPSADAQIVTSSGFARIGYKIYNSAPADHTINAGDQGNDNYLGAGYFNLA